MAANVASLWHGNRSVWVLVMVNLIRLLFLVCVSVVSFSASALVPKGDGYKVQSSFWPIARFDTSAMIACDAYATMYANGVGGRVRESNTETSCRTIPPGQPTLWNTVAIDKYPGAICPANSDPSGAQCQCRAGFDETGGQCIAHVNQCTSRPPSVVNYTAGWQRTPNIGSDEKLIAPNTISGGVGSMCVGGCTTEVNVAEACPDCKASVSQVPNDQGLYRVSVELMGKATGTECTAGSADAPATPDNSKDPPCPGYVGEINGVKGCYGTAASPVSGVQWTQGKDLPKTPGNPPAGINNRATPSTGSGGSAGGPAGAANGRPGSAGTGTVAGSGNGSGRVGTQEGTEQQACGAPGQPKCDVKVDESGTAKDAGTSFDGAKGELDTNKQSAQDAISGAHSITAPTWSFSFQLPTGCTAYQVGTFKGTEFTFNPCQYQGMIHDLLSMVWAAVTAFCIIGMVGRTIRES